MVPPGACGDEGTRGRRGLATHRLPQQATEPSLLTPQVWNHPALTETKEPAGGVAWPAASAAPAGDGAVAPHPAGVEPSGADGDEGIRGRRGLAVVIVAPAAGDGAVAPHPAGVERRLDPALTESKEPAGGVAWP